ncbi:MAG: hypothetical protein RQ743_08690 [Bacteroidales bacterium]|nr:hypothetical protein [Bacteroidales bacterium]
MEEDKMNFKMHRVISLLIPLLILIMVIGSCSSRQSEKEAQKLLDKQKSAIEKGDRLIDETFNEIQVLKDSLESEQERLEASRSAVEEDIKELESGQEEFAETLKDEKEAELARQKADLQARLSEIEDSIDLVLQKSKDIRQQQDTLEIKEQQLAEQKSESKEKLVTGIDNIDSRLDEIEEQRLVKLKEIELNEQKIKLAEKKIELLEDEKNIYLREKNEVLKKNGDEAELEKYDLKISEINGYLNEEQNKIKSAESNINTLTAWISDADALQEKLRDMMDSEYDRDKTIAEFSREEINRLEKERQALDQDLENLNILKSKLSEKKANLNNRIVALEEETELVKSKELSEILDEISGLEAQEAQLAEREKEMLEKREAPEKIEGISRLDTESGVLESIEETIELRRKQIDILRSEIAEDEAQLSKQAADIEARRARNVRNATKTVLIIGVIGVILIGLFYTLGRRKRKKTNN